MKIKKISLIVLLFFCCSLISPLKSKAFAPLVVLAPAVVGASLLALAAGTAVTQVALNTTGEYGIDSSNLTVPIAAYNTYMQAGAQVALGYLSSIPFDFQTAWNTGLITASPEIQTVASQLWLTASAPTPGSVFAGPSGNYIITSGFTPSSYLTDAQYQALGTPVGGLIFQSGSNRLWEKRTPYGTNQFLCGYYSTTPSVENPNWPGQGVPAVLDPSATADLVAAIAAAAPANPALRTALDNVVKASPQLLTPPAPITQAQVDAYINNKVNQSLQNVLDKAIAAAAANPSDLSLATEVAKAQAAIEKANADEISKIPEETFSPLNPSAFAIPYNPGNFNISSRFTTFINNVKSSPLFTFSNSFFNSLPSGGSPVYEIEAGQFGHHTIDLSQTMTGGFVVLKTVLLAVFGFLSIRTIIMKR